MYHLRRWNHHTHHPSHVTSSSSTTTITMMNEPQQEMSQQQQQQQRPSSQIPMQLEMAMKKMNTTYDNYDDFYQDNIHSNTNTEDEITMDDCITCRRKNHKSSSTESTIQYCYYSITSLFRNHKKVLLQDGLTKCRTAGRDDERPVSSSLLSDTFQTTQDDSDIDATRTGSNSIDVQVHRQLVNEFDRTTMTDDRVGSNTNNTKKHSTVYHIDTSIVQEQEPSKKATKKSQQEQEEDYDDQVTALETPSPVHTDDETTDSDKEEDGSPRNPKEPKHLKFFRRGKLV